jgi:hypothetical protein
MFNNNMKKIKNILAKIYKIILKNKIELQDQLHIILQTNKKKLLTNSAIMYEYTFMELYFFIQIVI